MRAVNSLIVILLLLAIFPSYGQSDTYFIYFADKKDNTYSIDAPEQFLSEKSILRRLRQNIAISERDLPVTGRYIDSIRSTGASVLYTSKWFNAALVKADSEQLKTINTFSFLAGSENLRIISQSVNINSLQAEQISEEYGGSATQIKMHGIDQMHSNGYRGEGITIAVLDNGFLNADKLSVFDSLNVDSRVDATYDFPNFESNVYNDGGHGTSVLSILAGFKDGSLIGSAWKANYILLKTEVESSESLLEEAYWLLGAEYADSAGADIISSSLGYNTFDKSTQNHSYDDLDGKTTLISRAAEMAFETGMLVVNSAGNEGNRTWKYILAPADAEHVLTVGAVDASGNYAPLSSQGPTADGRIKPDVVSLGLASTLSDASGTIKQGNGTSYASPVISGFCANLWQQFPMLTNQELLDLVKQSSSQFSNPDMLKGYGIPKYQNALTLVGIDKSLKDLGFVIYPNPCNDFLFVTSQSNEPIEVFDIYSKLLLSTSSKTIDVSTFPSGLYYVRQKAGTSFVGAVFVK